MYILGELQGVFAVSPPVYAKPKDQPAVKPPTNPYNIQQSPSNPPPNAYATPTSNTYATPTSSGVVKSSEESQKIELKKRAKQLITKECSTIGDEIIAFMSMQENLEESKTEIDNNIAQMNDHKRQVKMAMDWTKKASEDLDEQIAKIEREDFKIGLWFCVWLFKMVNRCLL